MYESVSTLSSSNCHLNDLTVRGDRIHALRKESGLTIQELARLSGLSVGQIYRLEKNERPNTAAVTLARIALALDTTLDYLMGLSDEPERRSE